ncbi:protein timeless [Bicyclus anynana]|uniref:Protein timeless n=1 Tax=Bicyclus anynana TaxID=110368 RepID=A0ABM3M737_BICAN|nr:protein timeless [Bicyclus anynana]
MEWILRSPQILNTFGSLGYALPEGYHINENCNSALESILENLLTENKLLRTYRRNLSIGQNIKKDLIPLLLNTKDDNTMELLIKIFVNLTIPVECLLPLDSVSKTDIGRHTIYEINNLLSSIKIAVTDHRVTKVVIDFLKKNSDTEPKTKLSIEQCTNISNTLLFLRNILHIPENVDYNSPTYSGPPHTVQNQLVWNLFSNSIDKVLIKLMTIPDAINWGVTMVQLIALFYKDQHVTTLHKLLNLWLEASLSESSEDNESNTSPPNRGSDDSSPMLTSDPTSDSSDTGASGKCNGEPNSVNNGWGNSTNCESEKQNFQPNNADSVPCISEGKNPRNFDHNSGVPCNNQKSRSKEATNIADGTQNTEKKIIISETSDCGYGTQIENQESISTSSNEDDIPEKKPVHQKPHTTKPRINNKVRAISVTLQERKRKKIVKRGKSNIINVQGLSHSTPTNDDISNVLKEFTVDFLLKGYNSLVRTLHSQILTNVQLEIDTSHFFWLVTYFLKFATQIELDLEHVCWVLSYEIISYLTAEGVNLCEQFELAIKLDGNDLKPSIRRLHLVVTAIREFVQAIEVYKKSAHICNNDKQQLDKLQVKMCESDELRSLLVLLLRYYNPKYHSKQYLQDLVVTNHILLMFMDSIMKLPDYKGTGTMADHIRQFCAPEIMYQYGLLLEDYEGNGEFVNDCIFTLMHHVGGDMGSLISLFQPKILKTFTLICKTEFEMCDDWTDLIDYVINTFVKKPCKPQSSLQLPIEMDIFDEKARLREMIVSPNHTEVFLPEKLILDEEKSAEPNNTIAWSEDELATLSWNYMQCNDLPDVVGEIVKMFKDDGIVKDRESVIKELYNQFIINKDQFDTLSKKESTKTMQDIKETRENEIGKLCEQLIQDGKSRSLDWVQTVLLEACAAKVYLDKMTAKTNHPSFLNDAHPFAYFLKKPKDLPVLSSVSYHSLILNRSIPLVPWNCQQAAICKDLKFLQLLHRLGLHMPVDTGKVFIRIPHFWTPDFLYEVAAKISPVDTSTLKFSLNDISQSSILNNSSQTSSFILPELSKGNALSPTPDNFYQINKKQNLFASIMNFTPTPGSSFSTTDENLSNPNWLEVVQKSQEYKISLDLGKSIIAEDEDEVMQVADEELHVSLEAKPRPLVTPAGPVTLMMSTIMSVKQETTNFTIGQAESDYCNNSVCDTASVASDLTRMYVSDEDDKPEPLLLAERSLKAARHELADMADSGASKRPRVDFSPPF